jgi:hypothetical protein
MFAKRKRSPFKGPMLSLSTAGFGTPSKSGRSEGSVSRSSSVQRKRSSELAIQEEDEEEGLEEYEEGVEMVDEFSPVKPGEVVEVLESR